MSEAVNRIIDILQKKGYEGDVLAFEENSMVVENELGLRMRFSRRKGYATRWKAEKRGIFFHFSTSGELNLAHTSMISEAVDLVLPSKIRKSGVKLADERGLPFGEELEFPNWITSFSGKERKILLRNTRQGEASYRETLFSFTGEVAGEKFIIWSRRRDFPRAVQSPGGKYMVLHPLASFKMLKTILSGRVSIRSFAAGITEDPSIDFAPGSYPFDASGREMKRRIIFKKGKLKARKPIHLVRKSPESPPSMGWTNIVAELPTVNCEAFTLVLNLRFYGAIVELVMEGGREREMNTEDLLASVSGKIRDGWFIGPPYIKSDYILLDQYS